MDSVKFKREQEQYLHHIERVRNTSPVLDSKPPESLGLKHLATRPKKMQLLEDKRHAIAKENNKLMGLMTKIMNEKREQPKHIRPPSLNEQYRKRLVDRVNFENSLMVERLKKVAPVIRNEELARDFKRHLKAESHLRRRQMKPLSVPKDMYKGSPVRSPAAGGSKETSLFDSSLYTAHKSAPFMKGSSLEQLSLAETNAPIKSVTDFRREVIATKKLQQRAENILPPASYNESGPGKGGIQRPYHDSDSLFEIQHNPS